MSKKNISVPAIQSLKDALTHIYWYKDGLRSFLTQIISEPSLLSRLNWQDYKRNIVATLVDYLAINEKTYRKDILKLIAEVCEMRDFSHLRRLNDGQKKAQDAERAVAALREHFKGHQTIHEEIQAANIRQEEEEKKLMRINAVQEKLNELKKEYFTLISSSNPQQRGFSLEKVLNGLFALFDLDPKASFRITGEQIDGAFSFDGTDFLLEAKWQKEPVAAKDLDGMAGKLSRKLENTLGLFISINGFSEDAVTTHSSGRRVQILMDGSDLMAVLEGRIDLVQLLLRKRRKAAETGNIYLKINEIM